MVVDNRTAKRNYPLPNVLSQREDIFRIVDALEAIGVDVDALIADAAGKSVNGHKHPIADVTGLQTVLDGKSPDDHQHALGALTDVSVDDAANGMVLKRVGLAWVASRILLGDIEGWEATVAAQVAGAITGLSDGAPGTLDTLNELAAALGDDPSFATTIATALGNRVRGDAAQAWSAGQKAQARANIAAQADLGFTPVRQGTSDVITYQWNAANNSVSIVINATYVGEMATQNFVAANYLSKSGGTIVGSLQVQGVGAQISWHYPGIRIWYQDVTADGTFRCVDSTGGAYGWAINTAGQMSVRGYGWLHEYFATSASLAATNAALQDRVYRTGYGDYGETGAVLGAWSKVPAGKYMTGFLQASNGIITHLASQRGFMNVPVLGGWNWSQAV